MDIFDENSIETLAKFNQNFNEISLIFIEVHSTFDKYETLMWYHENSL